MDKLTAMRVFARVVELGSFTKAADALALSRTMTTVHVARLEESLAVRLLNRTTRRLSLTEAGLAYYDKCAALLAEIDTLEGSLAAMSEQPRGVLKISAPVSFGSLELAPALADYLGRYPLVRLDVNLNDRTVDLVEEGYDLAIRIAPAVDPGLVARRLASTRLRVCASPGYVARQGVPQRPADLSLDDCFGYAYSGSVWAFEGPEGHDEIRPRGDTRANSGDFLRVLAVQGHGIALLPSFLVHRDLASGALIELLPAYRAATLGVHAVYPSRKHLAAKVRTLVDFLVERFGRQALW